MTAAELAATRVPRWALVALALALPFLVAAAFKLGAVVTDHLSTTRDLDRRMCRLEFAMHLDPWATCSVPRIVNGRLIVAGLDAGRASGN